MSLPAAQVIYTNVEKKLSPTGREGFQVWLRTPGALDDGEQTELQTRLADYEERRDPTTKDEPAVRHSFFRLSSGKAAVARTVPLTETDQFKRGGRFYAHALVLEPDDFRALGNDPFAVLDQATFHQKLDDGIKFGDVSSGTIPVAILEARAAERCPPPVAADKLPALIPALLRTFDQEKAILLGVCAPPTKTLGLLRQLFQWLPPSLRAACSFDTLSNGRSLTQLPYCVTGLPAAGPPRRYLNLVLFDLTKQAFPQPMKPAADGTFARWLAEPLSRGVPPERSKAEAAYQLGLALDSGWVDANRLTDVDPAMFEEIAYSDVSVPKLDAILNQRLVADVGEVLAPLIASHAVHWLRAGGLGAFRDLGGPLHDELLLSWLLAVYEQRPRSAVQVKTEFAALKDIYDRTKTVEGANVATLRKRLILIASRWAGKWEQIAKWVVDPHSMTDETYQWFALWSLRTLPVRIERGAGRATTGTWCGPHVFCDDPTDDEECQRLVGAILGQAGDAPPALPPDRWAWVFHELLTRTT